MADPRAPHARRRHAARGLARVLVPVPSSRGARCGRPGRRLDDAERDELRRCRDGLTGRDRVTHRECRGWRRGLRRNLERQLLDRLVLRLLGLVRRVPRPGGAREHRRGNGRRSDPERYRQPHVRRLDRDGRRLHRRPLPLRSDRPQRDGQLRRQALETGTYPTATFKLTQPMDLGTVPADGQVIESTATGDLTIHGTTKSVQIPVEARVSGDVVTVTGSTDILFADYGISRPQSFMVLSIADRGTMEFQLQFTKA
ncbi:MAG: YceI family protein [Chloroflexota bacterium]